MEITVKMVIKNNDGKEIVKDIPENLSAFYKNAGWNFYKEIVKTKNENKKKQVCLEEKE